MGGGAPLLSAGAAAAIRMVGLPFGAVAGWRVMRRPGQSAKRSELARAARAKHWVRLRGSRLLRRSGIRRTSWNW